MPGCFKQQRNMLPVIFGALFHISILQNAFEFAHTYAELLKTNIYYLPVQSCGINSLVGGNLLI